MPAVVVDTDVVSFQFKRDTRAAIYDPHLAARQWVMSFMTLAELERWALTHRWGTARRARLERHVRRFVIVHSDDTLCRWWAEVNRRADRAGRPIAPPDAWIAATALALDIPLITHNPGDYGGVTRLRIVSGASP